FGRAKTLFQLLMAATVANLTLVATKAGLMRGQGKRQYHLLAPIVGAVMALIATFTLSIAYNPELTLQSPARKVGFRPGF
ncbi:MAG: hypothetical protein Q8R28_11780, partial [Dehalococcoidia bacterium]|nr:hypothetical protein [Dehalococcoidia bacterium]